MCCGPYDYDYPTYGGKYQRTDPAYGRVGSPFSDPATAGYGPSADSNLEASNPGRMREAPEDISDLDDGDLESLENELNLGDEMDDLDRELDGLEDGGNAEPLPSPDVTPQPESDGNTASRAWRQRIQRENQRWR